jgi:hypothetical protein
LRPRPPRANAPGAGGGDGGRGGAGGGDGGGDAVGGGDGGSGHATAARKSTVASAL